jgi:cytoskeleton protein RodZ
MVETEEETVAETDPIGSRLKAAREAQGMSLDDVAAKTRVPIRHLQHMERGEWDALPATTYSVGFARAYAGAVGLNPSEIGSELRAQLGTGAKTPAQAALYEPADPARVPPLSLAIIAGVIALLLVAAYLFWRNSAVEDAPVGQDEVAVADAGPAAAPGGAPPPAPAIAPAATGPVTITATDEVWLRVYEAGGANLVEKIFKAGETYQVPATATRPQIITGRPNAIRVNVGSTVIPPLGPPEKTVADVSLLPADLIARPAPSAAPAAAKGPANAKAPAKAPAPAR